MYNGVATRVRTTVGETKAFPITIGVHQGTDLSTYHFILSMDNLLGIY